MVHRSVQQVAGDHAVRQVYSPNFSFLVFLIQKLSERKDFISTMPVEEYSIVSLK